MTTSTAASPELEALTPFVGSWETEGEMKTGFPGKPATFRATDTYEWLPGGHFLLHRFDADVPEGKVEGIEIIGYDSENRSFPMHSFDSAGNASVMQARKEEDTWSFLGEALRFTGGFQENGKVFAGLWETRPSPDTPWQLLMEVSLKKMK